MNIEKMWDWKQWIGKWNLRLSAARVYLIISAVLIVFVYIFKFWSIWTNDHWIDLLWVAAWSSAGIGAWLINTRDSKGKHDNAGFHYLLYFGFAFFVVSLTAFTFGRHASGSLNYCLSALIGLSMGFASERLHKLGVIKNGG